MTGGHLRSPACQCGTVTRHPLAIARPPVAPSLSPHLAHPSIPNAMRLLNLSINLPRPPMSPAKDPADYPFSKGILSRWLWPIYTQRLTVSGRWFLFLSIIFLSYSGVSLSLQGYVPAAYVFGVWLVTLAAMTVTRPRVSAHIRVADRIAAGERLPLDVTVTNHSAFRGGDLTVVPHRLPRAVDCLPEEGLRVGDLELNESRTLRIHLVASRRGVYQLRGVRVESSFPFGLVQSRRTFHLPSRLVVYPGFTPLSSLAIPTGRRLQPGGVALASSLGESFEYLGNREYRQGDNIRDIDWRATARVAGAGGNSPIVRQWVEEYMLRVGVVLDTHVPDTLRGRRKAARSDAFECAVSLAAAISDHMARRDYLVDLFAAGGTLYHLTAGRSLAYLDQILDILAAVEEARALSFHLIEPELDALIDRLSTVVVVLTDFDPPRQAFVRRLEERGAATRLIVVSDSLGEAETAAALAAQATLLTTALCKSGVKDL